MTKYEWYKAHGICPTCGCRDAAPGRVQCPECLEKERLKAVQRRKKESPEQKEYHNRHRQRRTDLLHAFGRLRKMPAAGRCPRTRTVRVLPCPQPPVHAVPVEGERRHAGGTCWDGREYAADAESRQIRRKRTNCAPHAGKHRSVPWKLPATAARKRIGLRARTRSWRGANHRRWKQRKSMKKRCRKFWPAPRSC